MSDSILIIKLGALGDFVQAAGPFAAIREHHKDAHITLMTGEMFGAFARNAPWFDEVWIDKKPRISQVGKCLRLRTKLRTANFSRIYDLQTSDRSGFYYRLFWPGPYPEWSGIAGGCSHPHANPNRDFMHTIERQKEQLAMAGIENVSAPDFSWVSSETSRFSLAARYALLAPGGAAHRPDKRWPGENFQELTAHLAEQEIQPVLIGGAAEKAELSAIARTIPSAINLAGETSLEDLFVLARQALLAIGNDTGPMHAIAANHCPSIVLYSHASDPALCAQRGPAVSILRRESLTSLTPKEVIGEVEKILNNPAEFKDSRLDS